jgi:hypothetical protein
MSFSSVFSVQELCEVQTKMAPNMAGWLLPPVVMPCEILFLSTLFQQSNEVMRE